MFICKGSENRCENFTQYNVKSKKAQVSENHMPSTIFFTFFSSFIYKGM